MKSKMEWETPYVSYEVDTTKSLLAWKADMVDYVGKGFKLYNTNYDKVAEYIYKALIRSYGVGRWLVFVCRAGGKSQGWYQGGSCCELTCEASTDHSLHHVHIYCYKNEGYIKRRFGVRSALNDSKAITLEKGAVDDATLYCFFAGELLRTGEMALQVTKKLLAQHGKAIGIGDGWVLFSCQDGAFAGNYMEGEYLIFQYAKQVYAAFRIT